MKAFFVDLIAHPAMLVKIILLAASVILLLFGLISLLVTFAKKSNLFKKIVAGILVVAGLTTSIISGLDISSVYKLTEQQNYVACELLELESYESGRDMAEMANERVNNENSAAIISLSLGLSGDVKLCSKVSAEFLNHYPDSESLNSISELSKDMLKNIDEDEDGTRFEAYKGELTDILDDVKSSVKPKDEGSAEDVAEALSALEKGEYIDEDGEEVDGVKRASSIAKDLNQNDPLTLQLQAKIEGKKGNEKEAFKYLEKLVQKDGITSNKVALAACAINGGYVDKGSDSEREVYSNKVQSLEKKADKLEDKIKKADDDEEVKLKADLATVNSQIESLKNTIKNLDLIKAANFVTTLLSDINSTAVNAILAEISYLMDDVVKAEEYSSKIFAANLTDDINDRLTVDVIRILENDEYAVSDQNDIQTRIYDLIYKTHQGCTDYFLSSGNEDGIAENFATFLYSNVNSAVNAIKISTVTTTDLENFEVSVNISRDNESGVPYTKDDFAIYDMGVPVTDYDMITNSGNKTSVCLVFDNSGSMSGTNIEQAKEAVTGFIANVNPNVEVGLVRFDDTAEILCDVTTSTGQVTRAALDINAAGGTDIDGGLLMSIEALKNKSGNKIVILLTDGEDGDTEGIIAASEQLKQNGIVAYAVGFDGARVETLNHITSITGGQLMYAQNPEDLQEMYRLINGFISNDYTFTFRTSAQDDSYERTVRIVMPDGYYDEIDYTVGLSKEEIETVINEAPRSDYYQQIGGSNKNGGIY
ncbi:MAG: VWA domain-containing protein [Clostridia bacterium]|nr:VWA domain-containing protein [Clostridia bacterium]